MTVPSSLSKYARRRHKIFPKNFATATSNGRRKTRSSHMTPLADLLVARIRETGPLTLADYMTECLSHPRHGYYTTRDPLGAEGDFTTAPEISQMFGELLGLALAQSWLDQGAPKAFALAELGPGRGTLMADVLRATAKVPGFHTALSLHLVETSPTLRAKQTATIPLTLTHHETIDTLPGDAPLFLVANEFFDALPIRQFRRDGPAWREVLVGLDGERLTFGLSDRTAPEYLDQRLADTKDGDIVETSPASQTIARNIGQRIATNGGTALIIDYGNWRSRGDTFQALESHQSVNPLARPGQADLTAHVDFEVSCPRRRTRRPFRHDPARCLPRTPRHFAPRPHLGRKADRRCARLPHRRISPLDAGR